MAQLGNTVITGSLSVTDTIYGTLSGAISNATCFNGRTYAQACCDIRCGLCFYNSTGSMGIGCSSTSVGTANNLVVGLSAKACCIGNVVIGNSSTATFCESVVIGQCSDAGGYSTAIGYCTCAVCNSIAIGTNACAYCCYDVIIGSHACTSTSHRGIAIGYVSGLYNGDNAIAIGYNSHSNGDYLLSIGADTTSQYFNGFNWEVSTIRRTNRVYDMVISCCGNAISCYTWANFANYFLCALRSQFGRPSSYHYIFGNGEHFFGNVYSGSFPVREFSFVTDVSKCNSSNTVTFCGITSTGTTTMNCNCITCCFYTIPMMHFIAIECY